MLKPLNKESAFAAIAHDLELPLVLLSNPDPRVRLVQIEKIGAALLSTNLTWRDLAERVVAPRTLEGQPITAGSSPALMSTLRLRSEIAIDPAAVLSNDELQRLGGYRTAAVSDRPHAEVGTLADPAAPSTLSVEAELHAFGYRADPAPHFGRYGCGPIPDEFESIPGESVESAGDRLALWAMARCGQPFWQDPATGRAYMPGVTVPGAGVVRNDGTLGPLPAEE